MFRFFEKVGNENQEKRRKPEAYRQKDTGCEVYFIGVLGIFTHNHRYQKCPSQPNEQQDDADVWIKEKGEEQGYG